MNRKTFCAIYSGAFVISVFLFGCGSPKAQKKPTGISPIYPAINNTFANRYQTIETLSPEFRWKDLKETNQTYDLAIWELPYRSEEDFKSKLRQIKSSWGNLIFITNNIATNTYQLPSPLKPNTYYNWSVRICEGDQVRGWNCYTTKEVGFYDEVVHVHEHVPFSFKTPTASDNREAHVANP